MYGLKHFRDVQASEQGVLVKTLLDLDADFIPIGFVTLGDCFISLSLSFPVCVSQCIVMIQGDVVMLVNSCSGFKTQQPHILDHGMSPCRKGD